MAEHTKISPIKAWLIAVRPFAYTASISAVLLGLALSFYAGFPIKWLSFFLTLLGVLCFHTAGNLISDVFDFKRGLDRIPNPTSGAIVRGLLNPKQVFVGALLFLCMGIGIGLYFVFTLGVPILWLGLCGTLIALCYTGPQFGFKYRRMGDIAILLAFGFLPVLGTFYVQTSQISWLPLVWFIPITLITVGILHANNWRDITNDTNHDCKTIAQLLGPKKSPWYYSALVLLPYLFVFLSVVWGQWITPHTKVPLLTLLVFITLPKALYLTKKRETNKDFVMLDGMTAQLQLSFSFILIASFFVAPFVPQI